MAIERLSWAVCQTKPAQEYRAARHLRHRSCSYYLPQVSLGRPLFPGYVFPRVTRSDWSFLTAVVGILRVLTTIDTKGAQLPSWLTDDAIAQIMGMQDDHGYVRLPKSGLKPGDKITMLKGPFEGQLGIFSGMTGADRVRVLLAVLGRQTSVTTSVRDIAAA